MKGITLPLLALRAALDAVAGGNPPQAGHPNTATISPCYSAPMPVDPCTLAEAMKAEGYGALSKVPVLGISAR